MGGRGGSPNAGPRGTASAPAAPAGASGDQLETDILRTYETLRDRFNNDWVILTEIRDRVGGSKAEQDRVLLQLVKDRKIRLIPEENQKTLRPEDWAAGINVGGEQKHLMGIIH